MRTIPLGKTGLAVPAVALGCMRLTALDERGAQAYIRTALEYGANFFDHADIYGGGTCEELFGKAIAGIPREELSSSPSAASSRASATTSPASTSCAAWTRASSA